MAVARMRAEMPNTEFLRWQNFYAREAQIAEVEKGG